MRRFSVLIAMIALCAARSSRADDIYGADDRLDVYEAPADLQELARSAVFITNAGAVTVSGGRAHLAHDVYGKAYGLVRSERFYDQPSAGDWACSGALIAPDLVLTAGHCINQDTCAGTSLIFDYAMTGPQADPTDLPEDSVRSCKKVEVSLSDPTKADWALVRLDRPVSGRPIIQVERRRAKRDEAVVLIGYPSGLPAKIVGGARVRSADIQRGVYFTAPLDAAGGDSGGPVFDARTHRLVGVFVRGGADFVDAGGGLKQSARLPQAGGMGGMSQASAKLAKKLKQFLKDEPRFDGGGR